MTTEKSQTKSGLPPNLVKCIVWFAALLVISPATLQGAESMQDNQVVLETPSNECLHNTDTDPYAVDKRGSIYQCLLYATNHYKSFSVVSIETELETVSLGEPPDEHPSDVPGWRDIVWQVTLTNLVKRTHLPRYEYWPDTHNTGVVNLYEYLCRVSDTREKSENFWNNVLGVCLLSALLVFFCLFPRQIIALILLAVGIHYTKKAIRKIVGCDKS